MKVLCTLQATIQAICAIILPLDGYNEQINQELEMACFTVTLCIEDSRGCPYMVCKQPIYINRRDEPVPISQEDHCHLSLRVNWN